MPLSVEAAEIRLSRVSDLALSRSARAANWALARLVASMVISTPLPPPSAVTSDWVAEPAGLMVVMEIRTAGGVGG